MNSYKYQITIIIILFLVISLPDLTSQNRPKLDSLWTIYEREEIDTNQLKTLYQLSLEYKSFNPDSSLLLANRLIAQSKKIDYSWGLAQGYAKKAQCNFLLGNIDEVLSAIEHTMPYLVKMKDSLGIADILFLKGKAYSLRNRPNSFKYLEKSFKAYQKLGNKRGMSTVYMYKARKHGDFKEDSLAILHLEKSFSWVKEWKEKENLSYFYFLASITYVSINKYKEAIINLEKAADLNPNSQLRISIYNYLGRLNFFMGDYSKALVYTDSLYQLSTGIGSLQGELHALGTLFEIFYKLGRKKEALKSLDLAIEKMDQEESHVVLLDNMIIFGLAYLTAEEYDKAIELFKRGADILELKINSDQQSRLYFYIAKAFFKKGSIKEAERYLRKIPSSSGLNMDQEVALLKAEIHFLKGEWDLAIKNGEVAYALHLTPQQKTDITDILSKAYAKTNNYKKAYEYAQLEKEVILLLKEEAIKETTQQLSFQFTSKQKDLEIQSLEKEQSLILLKQEAIQKDLDNRTRLNWIFAAFGIVAFLAFFQFYQNNKKNKQIAQHNRILVEKEQLFKNLRNNLFANISHEFRTPLSILKTAFNEISKDTTRSSFQRYASVMYRNVENLINLSNQMLDLAKMSENKIQINQSEVAIAAEVKAILSLFSSMVEQNNQKLAFTAPQEPLMISIDRDILQKIILNLVYNAIKFTPKGGSIEVLLTYQASSVVIVVSDTGIGIASKHIPFIFERYYRPALENSQSETGGLGLALTKQLVELYKGTIEVESHLGKGTTFTVTLPHQQKSLALETYSTMETHNIETPSVPSTPTFNSQLLSSQQLLNQSDSAIPLILIVEDNEDLHSLLFNKLSEDYRVISAYNGQEALQKIKITTPDLILTDVMMPVMNGIELAGKLLSDINYSHIPIIVLSALESDVDNLKLWKNGIVDFVNKPFAIDILKYRIKNQLKSREQIKARIFNDEWSNVFAETTIPSADKIFLQNLIDSIEENMGKEDFSVEKLSKTLAMSRSGLYHKIKTLTGHTPTTFLRKYRLNKAKKLLSQGSGNISELAMQVGYYNSSQFSRIFKAEFGFSPSSLVLKE